MSLSKRQFIEHQWSRASESPTDFSPDAIEWIRNEPGMLDHLISLSKAREVSAKADRALFTALRDGTSRNCANCSLPFAPARADATYCSGSCRQQAYRSRRAAQKQEEVSRYYTEPIPLGEAKAQSVLSVICSHTGRGHHDDQPEVVLQVDVDGPISIHYANPLFSEFLGRNAYWLEEAGNRRNGRPARLPESAVAETAVREVLKCSCGVQVKLGASSDLWRRLTEADQWIVELRALSTVVGRLNNTPQG